jgi:Spy/CpxP family protein refolding chaperone
LTPEQRKQVKAIRASAKAGHKARRGGHAAFMSQLAAAISSGDDSALEEAFNTKLQAGEARNRRKLAKLRKVLAILTDEQRAKVAAKIGQMQKRHYQNQSDANDN